MTKSRKVESRNKALNNNINKKLKETVSKENYQKHMKNEIGKEI
jgi:hypothetical protein